ncbi:MAG: hypothetical protein ACLUNO_03935 [Oscillospiraceae bacterium]
MEKLCMVDCSMGCAAGDMLTAALLELHPDPGGVSRRDERGARRPASAVSANAPDAKRAASAVRTSP